MTSERGGPDSRQAWVVVVGASMLMGMGSGSLISISTFLRPIVTDFGWLRSETSFAYTLGAICMGFGGVAMGWVSDRFSARPVVMVGILFLGGSLLLLSTQGALWQFYLYYCMLGGLGASTLDAPLIATIGSWFERNKGLALGLALAGRSLGQGGVPFVAGLLIADWGWRGTYALLGGACLVLMLPLTLLIRNPPGLAEAKAASRGATTAERLRAYPIEPHIIITWLSCAALFCCTCMGIAMVHAVAIAQEAGVGERESAGVILLVYLAGFFGRIAFGKLSDHIGGIRTYWLASFGQTVLIFWFTAMHSTVGFYAHAVVFGFFMAGVMTGLIVCVRELVPLHMRGTANGTVSLLAWIGMGAGGWQGGLFYDLSGDYTLSYAMAALAGAVNLAILGSLYVFVRRQTSVAAAT